MFGVVVLVNHGLAKGMEEGHDVLPIWKRSIVQVVTGTLMALYDIAFVPLQAKRTVKDRGVSKLYYR